MQNISLHVRNTRHRIFLAWSFLQIPFHPQINGWLLSKTPTLKSSPFTLPIRIPIFLKRTHHHTAATSDNTLLIVFYILHPKRKAKAHHPQKPNERPA